MTGGQVRGGQIQDVSALEALGARLLIGSALLPLALGKWGSYLGIPQLGLFVGDFLAIGGALVLFILGRSDIKASSRISYQMGSEAPAAGALIILVSYPLVRMLTTPAPGMLAVRDMAPFLYLALAPYFARAVAILGVAKTVGSIRMALYMHLAWVLPVAVRAVPSPILVGSTELLTLRPDIDAVFCAVAAAMLTYGVARGRRGLLPIAAIVLNLVTVAALAKRAGLVACTTSLLVLMILHSRRQGPFLQRAARARLTSTAVLLIWLGLVSAIALPNGPQRFLLDRLGIGDGASRGSDAVSAAATVDARWKAWGRLLEFSFETASRALFGYGPGTDSLGITGTRNLLSGQYAVRAPHNGYLFILVTFGLLGLTLWVCFVLRMISRAREAPQDASLHEGWSAAVLLLLALGSSATVGVVLEAPFGSVPLAMALGLMTASCAGNMRS